MPPMLGIDVRKPDAYELQAPWRISLSPHRGEPFGLGPVCDLGKAQRETARGAKKVCRTSGSVELPNPRLSLALAAQNLSAPFSS